MSNQQHPAWKRFKFDENAMALDVHLKRLSKSRIAMPNVQRVADVQFPHFYMHF